MSRIKFKYHFENIKSKEHQTRKIETVQLNLNECRKDNQNEVLTGKELDICNDELRDEQISKGRLKQSLKNAKWNIQSLEKDFKELQKQMALDTTENENRIQQLERENTILSNEMASKEKDLTYTNQKLQKSLENCQNELDSTSLTFSNQPSDHSYNLLEICEIFSPIDLVFYIATSIYTRNSHLMFYSNIITAIMETFAFKLLGSTKTKIRVKTYSERNGQLVVSQIWSIVDQQIRIVLI